MDDEEGMLNKSVFKDDLFIQYFPFPVCEGDGVSSSTPPVATNMVMMSQGHAQSQQQQQQGTGNMTMTTQNMNIIQGEMQQAGAGYQQVSYTSTSYGSPMVHQQQQQQPQQHQQMMQSIYQQQQQQQSQMMSERIGDMVRNGSSDTIVKLAEQQQQVVGVEHQTNANMPISMYLPDSRGVHSSVGGAEQYQMVTTTTSGTGQVMGGIGVGMEQAYGDNNGSAAATVRQGSVTHSETGS